MDTLVKISAGRLLRVLARVSQALSQFVKPIASSGTQSTTQSTDGQAQGFERTALSPRENEGQSSGFKRFSGNPEPESQAKVVPLPNREKPPQNLPAQSAPRRDIAASEAFVLFYHQFSQHRQKLVQWLGKRVYRVASTASKVRKYRKGAMLDRNAE